MKRILFTGGGTAGHVSPNLALIPYFLDDGYEVHYIGSRTGIEKNMIQPPVVYHEISTGKLRRYFSMKNFTDPFRIIRGYGQCLSLLKKLRPQIIFSKGGFVSVPVCLAAKHYHIPVILHESDFTPGLANKICMPYCKVICTSFEETLKHTGDKGILTGTPIRREILNGNRQFAKSMLKGFDPKKPTVLFMGGSLGAQAINACLHTIAEGLTRRYNIIHICGKGNLNTKLARLDGYAQFEFITQELPDFFAYADFVVSRSGATSIFEFLAVKKPMLLIPLPASASRGDQILNANYFSKCGYAKVLKQEDMTPETLQKSVDDLYQHLDLFRQALNQSKMKDSNQKVLNLLYEHMLPEKTEF